MKRVLFYFAGIVLLSAVGGCGGPAGEKTLLTVEFKTDQTLRYEFTSRRNIDVDWGIEPKTKGCCGGSEDRSRFTRNFERMIMVVAYRPVEVDSYGLTTIEATCESVEVERRSRANRSGATDDAVKSLVGKTFRFTVTPSGRIEDYSQLDELVRRTGEKAFRSGAGKGRIKEPDMIADFVSSQWFLWDSISSIKDTTEGVRVGQSWKSKLSVPTPMVMREARDVTYTFAGIRRGKRGQLAVIRSSYNLAESVPAGWPVPYHGRFKVSGMFGFLTNYKILELKGDGDEIFNIDTGQIVKYTQKYKMKIDASLRFPLGPKPVITIDQSLVMKRRK